MDIKEPGVTTWGGQAVQHGGQFHMFVSEYVGYSNKWFQSIWLCLCVYSLRASGTSATAGSLRGSPIARPCALLQVHQRGRGHGKMSCSQCGARVHLRRSLRTARRCSGRWLHAAENQSWARMRGAIVARTARRPVALLSMAAARMHHPRCTHHHRHQLTPSLLMQCFGQSR